MVCLAAVCGLVLIVVGAAVAASQPGIDRSFGANGVVDLNVSGGQVGQEGSVAWAASPDGSSFVLGKLSTCPGGVSCTRAYSLRRYGPDGTFDQAFGDSGVVTVVKGVTGTAPGLTVDADGRPVVVWGGSKAITVARYAANGAVDGSFGAGGQTSFPCECERQSYGLTVLPEGKLLLHERVPFKAGSKVVLRRLLPTGALDRGFGDKGVGALTFTSGEPALYSARPNGSVVFAGPTACCSLGTEGEPRLGRISVAGRQDRGFEKAAAKSLLALPGAGDGKDPWLTTLIARPDGQVDVLGSADSGGFVLRLKANGKLQRSFADNGVRPLARRVFAAARDAAGGIFAVGDHPKASAPIAFRLFSDGRPDRRFKNFALTRDYFPIAENMEVATVSGLRALVYSNGVPECRGWCEVLPRLAMFQEPRPGRRP